jgi:hypothetical protein
MKIWVLLIRLLYAARSSRSANNYSSFPGWWPGSGGPVAWSPRPPDLTPLDPDIQLYSQYGGWTEGRGHCSYCRCYRGQVGQCVTRGGIWVYAEQQMVLMVKVFASSSLSFCACNELFQLMKRMKRISYPFSFLNYRCLKPRHFCRSCEVCLQHLIALQICHSMLCKSFFKHHVYTLDFWSLSKAFI